MKILLTFSILIFLGFNIDGHRPVEKILMLAKEIRKNMVQEVVEAVFPLLENCCSCGDGSKTFKKYLCLNNLIGFCQLCLGSIELENLNKTRLYCGSSHPQSICRLQP